MYQRQDQFLEWPAGCVDNKGAVMFQQNAGAVDRAVRIILGLVLISLVFIGPKTAWGWLGLIPLLTGIFGYCALYSVLGIRTCPAKRA